MRADRVLQLSPDALAQALKPLAEAHGQPLGDNSVAIYHGLYGFNPVLCAFALCGLFFVVTWRSAVYALVAAVFSAIVHSCS